MIQNLTFYNLSKSTEKWELVQIQFSNTQIVLNLQTFLRYLLGNESIAPDPQKLTDLRAYSNGDPAEASIRCLLDQVPKVICLTCRIYHFLSIQMNWRQGWENLLLTKVLLIYLFHLRYQTKLSLKIFTFSTIFYNFKILRLYDNMVGLCCSSILDMSFNVVFQNFYQ